MDDGASDHRSSNKRPLWEFASAMADLAEKIESGSEALRLQSFTAVCILMVEFLKPIDPTTLLIDELRTKAENLVQASRTFTTVASVIDGEMARNCVKEPDSHSRNLLRLVEVMDCLQIGFEEFLKQGMTDLLTPGITAYNKVFNGKHEQQIMLLALMAFDSIPQVSTVIATLNEDNESAKALTETCITASSKVVGYVKNLFASRGLGTDW